MHAYVVRKDVFLQASFHNNSSSPLQPNCYSRVISVLGDEHIIIFAKRDISPWEELTYDYRSDWNIILLLTFLTL